MQDLECESRVASNDLTFIEEQLPECSETDEDFGQFIIPILFSCEVHVCVTKASIQYSYGIVTLEHTILFLRQ